jgi:hypothetical protein
VRHTDARRLTRSGAGEDDLDAGGKRAQEIWDLVWRHSGGPAEGMGGVFLPANVDEKRTRADKRLSRNGVDPKG